MTLYFGLDFDDLVSPVPETTLGGIQYLGPLGLLYLLESHLGLVGYPTDIDYLRIEQYRQLLRQYLERYGEAFFTASFEADQFATATELLGRRDELLSGGWNFELRREMPERLEVLARIEAIAREEQVLAPGIADRFEEVLRSLAVRKQPLRQLYLNEPLEMLPGSVKRLFSLLKERGVDMGTLPEKRRSGQTDLDHFCRYLASETGLKQKAELHRDGSLMIWRAKCETDAATFLAQLLAENPGYHPFCLIPEKNRALDNALIQEGIPSLGIRSASLARPSLQILKLIPAFLWQPIDPYKILEFVSLSVKPLADDLAWQIAAQMARAPGMRSDSWYAMINRYFDELKTRADGDSSINFQQIRNQYEFWFERKRYEQTGAVPKEEVIEIFDYLSEWAYRIFDEENGKNHSLLVLSQQAKKVAELLGALPDYETDLSHLELERIVRTIYEPSPVVFTKREKGHLPYVHQSQNVCTPVDELIWWNFVDREPDHFFSKWYQPELNYLDQFAVRLNGPQEKNQLKIWQKKRPFAHTQKRLLLIIPDSIEGQEVQAHPLFGDLQACFTRLEQISFRLEDPQQRQQLQSYFSLPGREQLPHLLLGRPPVSLEIADRVHLGQNPEESFTSLDALFYYPYQWVFRYKGHLRKSSILSVVKDITLMGNLAHRIFEMMFEEDIETWDKEQVNAWIHREVPGLLAREGAVLLMYGREPERLSFTNTLKQAAWSLLHLIQRNGWSVVGTEQELTGRFMDLPIRAKADLVLRRGGELAVVDLKWRGSTRRKGIIKSEEDLQLVMYSRLLTNDENWAHTGYFIIEKGEMITRNNLAFKEAIAVDPHSDHREVNQRIWDKMKATFEWRLGQLQRGFIEVRTQHTAEALEEIYEGQLMELLEMKAEDAPFDDYRTLINLID